MFNISKDIVYIGVDDLEVDLFEGQFVVPNGMSYNSYAIIDEKTAVMDSVDSHFGDEWLANVEKALCGRLPDYLVVLHMEPDHSANVAAFAEKYPTAKLIGNSKTFIMLEEFFGRNYEERRIVVADGDEVSLGKHTLKFVFAPMVHWPEVMFAYEKYEKALFSADAFGKFGARECDEPWDDEARRYYIGIVGKYGVQVQAALKKLSAYEINTVCPLHGPVLSENLAHYLGLYDKWSGYTPEKDGIMIAYTSVYGHTKAAAERLADTLKARGAEVVLYDVARSDIHKCVAEAFRYSRLVLATTTYNADLFPAMREFIECLTERNYQKRRIGIMENGSWSPVAASKIKAKFEKSKNIEFTATSVKIRSALNAQSIEQLDAFAEELLT